MRTANLHTVLPLGSAKRDSWNCEGYSQASQVAAMTLEDQVKVKPVEMGPEDPACISLRTRASEPVPGLAPLPLRVMRLNFTEERVISIVSWLSSC